jgi:NADH-quinone oxidoreductase subunit N
MTGAQALSLAPLVLAALAGLVAMALAPVARFGTVRAVAGALLAAALAVLVSRAGGPPAAPYALLADDALARFGAGLALLAGLGILSFTAEEEDAREGPALVAIGTAGAVALAGAAHAATLFLGLEITTLAMVALVLLSRRADAVEAGYKLFLLAGIGAASVLLGAAWLFAATGTLELAGWRDAGQAAPVAAVGAALLRAGLAFKFALVPFHMWTPDLFSGGSAPAAALAGAVSKAAVAIALLRLALAVAPGPVMAAGLAVAGAATVLFANLAALRQDSLARMLGYSTVAHSGYLALILAAGGALAGEAALVYIATYVPAVLAALCVAGALGPVERGALPGLVRAHPLAGAALALALVSMAGLPPTAGFIGKAYLFSTLAQAQSWVLLGAAAAGAAVAFFYYFRFATAAMATAEDASAPPVTPAARLLLLAAMALLLLPGLYPEPLLALASAAAP